MASTRIIARMDTSDYELSLDSKGQGLAANGLTGIKTRRCLYIFNWS
jgi:hypothetical protein